MVLWQPGLVFPHPVSKDQGFFFFFPQQFALPGFIRLYGRRSGVRRGTVRVRQVRYVEEGADINRCSQQTVWLNQVYGLRLHRDG